MYHRVKMSNMPPAVELTQGNAILSSEHKLEVLAQYENDKSTAKMEKKRYE